LRTNILYIEQPLSDFGLKRKDLGSNKLTRPKSKLLILLEGGKKDSFFKNFKYEIKSTKLVGLSGIVRKIRGFKERGKLRLKIS